MVIPNVLLSFLINNQYIFIEQNNFKLLKSLLIFL